MKYRLPVVHVSVPIHIRPSQVPRLTMSEHDSCQEADGPLTTCMIGSFPGNSNHDGVSDDLASAYDNGAYKNA